MFHTTFSQAKLDFKLNMAEDSGDAGKIDAFVQANNTDVQVLRGEARVTDAQIRSFNSSGKFVVGIGDQLMRIPVREICSEADVVLMNASYCSGMLVDIAYMAISETKRSEFVDALDTMTGKDHNVQRAVFASFERGRVSDEVITRSAKVDDAAYQAKITSQAQGNLGAKRVLKELLAEGQDVFDRVAPKLGSGHLIWEKYRNHCGEDISKLIATYAE